jgi:CheY-like chemotaxis protein
VFKKGKAMLNNRYILLVEDDENDVVLLQRAFQKGGMREAIKTVRDGQQAIAYLRGEGAYADRERFPMPFLVLLDLRMPRTDGFEVLQWIRSEPELKRLLVVVLTSSNLQSDVDRAYELGANSYLVKPVGFEEMSNLVQRFDAYWSEINRVPTTSQAPDLARTEPTLG